MDMSDLAVVTMFLRDYFCIVVIALHMKNAFVQCGEACKVEKSVYAGREKREIDHWLIKVYLNITSNKLKLFIIWSCG